MEWINQPGKDGPTAILKDGTQVIGKVYLSPDAKILRIVLPELELLNQLKIDIEHHLIDFRRL